MSSTAPVGGMGFGSTLQFPAGGYQANIFKVF
jgi:hypothetical protein